MEDQTGFIRSRFMCDNTRRLMNITVQVQKGTIPYRLQSILNKFIRGHKKTRTKANNFE